MSSYTKTANQTLIALQKIAANGVVVGTPVNVSSKLGGLIYARFGRRSASAATAGVNIRLEASSKDSGDNSWFPFAILTTAYAACQSQTLGTTAAGQKVLAMASTTGIAAGDVLFIDNAADANCEWGRVSSIVANTSATIEDNLINAQTGNTVYDSAEIYAPIALPEGAVRVRAVIDGSQFTQAFAVEVLMSTIDSIQ
jgi:hypothetical protein